MRVRVPRDAAGRGLSSAARRRSRSRGWPASSRPTRGGPAARATAPRDACERSRRRALWRDGRRCWRRGRRRAGAWIAADQRRVQLLPTERSRRLVPAVSAAARRSDGTRRFVIILEHAHSPRLRPPDPRTAYLAVSSPCVASSAARTSPTSEPTSPARRTAESDARLPIASRHAARALGASPSRTATFRRRDGRRRDLVGVPLKRAEDRPNTSAPPQQLRSPPPGRAGHRERRHRRRRRPKSSGDVAERRPLGAAYAATTGGCRSRSRVSSSDAAAAVRLRASDAPRQQTAAAAGRCSVGRVEPQRRSR